MRDHVQVLVVGGGPAGSTAAALLARAGLSVRLLERDRFPRYHIGESLLASCVSTLRLSGAYDAVRKQGFQTKRGAYFIWHGDHWLLDWTKRVGADAWSWQVDRATFDDILLRNAAARGAEVIEEANVTRILFDKHDRAVAAEWLRNDEEATNTTTFDFLVDASGRAGLLSRRHFDMRQPHDVFQNTAVWSYWTGAQLHPDSPEGAINCFSAPDNGWIWHIPLSDGRFSVGYVAPKQTFVKNLRRFGSLTDCYLGALAECDAVKELLDGARRVAEPQAEQDYSYVSERFCGPGYVIIGDAACFLDPLLSTGVHLATYAALVSAAAIATVLRGEMAETEALEFFDYIYRRAYARFLVLVSRMYRQYVGVDEYFAHAQDLTTVAADGEDAAAQSFTHIMAGLTDVRETGESSGRVATDVLIAEAEQLQDGSAMSTLDNMNGLDVSMEWNLWRDPLGPDSSMNDLHMTMDPVIGLTRRSR